ncbi:MAG TPA: acetyl-CoA carboxylase biotin carboxylase subunit [Ktedonobacteraceae bacterium]|nr:acetyl-CoA carboxylase biotin carboxylase subunit [Ktedonobacteraceae bacterium]
MFNKILVANRGEIACRIIRTCKQLGIETVAIYSEADSGALHVQQANESYLIGPAPVTKSYLNIQKIIEVARISGAEAIHPGYGLLSENADFAQACVEANVVFIGPPAAVIRAMGSKIEARLAMVRAGVPVVPGVFEPLSRSEVREAAKTIGYPVIVKASGGGGGIGMQVVYQEQDIESAFEMCCRAARQYFGNDEVYLEKYIEHPRHIEIQVLADQQGHILHLNERECSIQRRHQKVIEEAPSPIVTPKLRDTLGQTAIRGACAIHYVNVGTMEFVMDTKNNSYFLEMNTRIQVEHPVTELTVGLDIVAEQLRIAAGEPLSITQKQAEPRGHAIECRIYAEDPKRFLPSPGTITKLCWPEGEGLRIDTGVRAQDTVSPYYDPLIGKFITWGENREQAISRMQKALSSTEITGIKTNIPALRAIIDHPGFLAGQLETNFIEMHQIATRIAQESR